MPIDSGQVIHGRYRVISLFSEGGMSTVYDAEDTILNVRCALKEMVPYPGTMGTALPQLREQFQQEAQLLAELRHPNLPRVTDHFEEDGNAYLVMDAIRGKRLDEMVVEKGELTEEEVLGWAQQLMEAIAYCHTQSVIHRDIKPQNVIITQEGRAVLVDFGLAKLVDPNSPRTRTVMRGLGTPEYAPPEQYDMDTGRTDARTDVYSLGATLYHALAGKPPPMLSERVINPASLVPLRQYRDDISRTTDRAVMKALALKPAQRFQNIAEMHKALLGVPLPERMESVGHARGEPSSTQPPTATVLLPWRSAQRLQAKYPTATALVAVAVISLITAGTLWAAGWVGPESVSTPTVTSTGTATTTATPTSTFTPSPTETSTASPAPSPTASPPMPRATRTPEAVETLQYVGPDTPTPTRIFLLPTSTSTPTPTSTPRPSQGRPRPVPTEPPPPPTEPPPLPTETPSQLTTLTPTP